VWSQVPLDFFEPITVECPPSGKLGGPVWGTGTYTKDSTICVAGVHAGVITVATGGLLTVKRVPGLREYAATERFGVASTAYGAYADAFAVEAAAGRMAGASRAPPAPEPAPPSQPPPPSTATPPAVSTRTVALKGFDAHGAAAAAGPRVVAVAGLTGIGAAPPTAPRTIGVAGLSGQGAAGP
jgi:hypothetical protein